MTCTKKTLQIDCIFVMNSPDVHMNSFLMYLPGSQYMNSLL